jgi:hypothetical protein
VRQAGGTAELLARAGVDLAVAMTAQQAEEAVAAAGDAADAAAASAGAAGAASADGVGDAAGDGGDGAGGGQVAADGAADVDHVLFPLQQYEAVERCLARHGSPSGRLLAPASCVPAAALASFRGGLVPRAGEGLAPWLPVLGVHATLGCCLLATVSGYGW